MATIYTIGHGTRPIDELAGMLLDAGAGRLVDVRRFPGSRRNPQFGRDALARALAERGIDYDWREELGGRRRASDRPTRHPAWRNASFRAYADYMDTPEFGVAFARLRADARVDPPLAIMCSETVWWRCHRRLVADALVLEGDDVVHLLAPGDARPHQLHPALRRDARGRLTYDAEPTATLDL
ncbi:MAG TPA: DUF488 domain-containing protein [Actinomycetota bacterium]|nr:DUF488 domain-containing protein [Actinomycetota bacterium]